MARIRKAVGRGALKKSLGLDVEGYNEFLDRLDNVLDKTGAENLKTSFGHAAQIVKSQIVQNLEPHRRTGNLSAAVFIVFGKPEKADVLVGVNWREKAKEGWWLEKGTSRQSAQPYFRPAVVSTRGPVAAEITNTMKKIIDESAEGK